MARLKRRIGRERSRLRRRSNRSERITKLVERLINARTHTVPSDKRPDSDVNVPIDGSVQMPLKRHLLPAATQRVEWTESLQAANIYALVRILDFARQEVAEELEDEVCANLIGHCIQQIMLHYNLSEGYDLPLEMPVLN